MFGNKIIVGFVVVGILGFGLGVVAGLRSPARQDGVPHLIPYHGILEKDGEQEQAIDSDTVDFRVSLWDAPAAGNKVWPAADVYDEHSVNVYDGRFAFDIGSDAPYVQVPDTPLYLDIQVRGSGDADFVQLGGRQQFLSAPYAVAAQRSDTSGDLLLGEACTTDYDEGSGSCLDATTRKPFMWRSYDAGHADAAPFYDTGVNVDEWYPTVAGFRALDGGIDESTTVNPIQLEVISEYGTNTYSTWRIRADFASQFNAEEWFVHVLYVRRNLVNLPE